MKIRAAFFLPLLLVFLLQHAKTYQRGASPAVEWRGACVGQASGDDNNGAQLSPKVLKKKKGKTRIREAQDTPGFTGSELSPSVSENNSSSGRGGFLPRAMRIFALRGPPSPEPFATA